MPKHRKYQTASIYNLAPILALMESNFEILGIRKNKGQEPLTYMSLQQNI
jgi:hypothetical protein